MLNGGGGGDGLVETEETDVDCYLSTLRGLSQSCPLTLISDLISEHPRAYQ